MKKTLLVAIVLVVTVFVVSGCNAHDFIGADRAKEIALEKAGITQEEAVVGKVELDRDDGVWRYEIEFKKDYIEYDAEIRAIDGTILKWEIDTD